MLPPNEARKRRANERHAVRWQPELGAAALAHYLGYSTRNAVAARLTPFSEDKALHIERAEFVFFRKNCVPPLHRTEAFGEGIPDFVWLALGSEMT
jgi:hypothetical protein